MQGLCRATTYPLDEPELLREPLCTSQQNEFNCALPKVRRGKEVVCAHTVASNRHTRRAGGLQGPDGDPRARAAHLAAAEPLLCPSLARLPFPLAKTWGSSLTS